MIVFKQNVPEEVSERIQDALEAIEEYLRLKFGLLKITVTSTSDGKHMRRSKHYDLPLPNAVDIRIWDILKSIAAEIREELGNDYDVVVEKDHLHIEYDPKVK